MSPREWESIPPGENYALWHADRRLGIEQDEDGEGELSSGYVASALVEEMRRDLNFAYCRQRNCAHVGHLHDGEGCGVPGCECEGLKL